MESWPYSTVLLELLRLSQRQMLTCGPSIGKPSTSLSREPHRKISNLEKFRRKREQFEEFLSSVSVLKNMEPYERSKLAEALKEERFHEGDFVIKQVIHHQLYIYWLKGDQGNVFYIVLEGEAVASK